MSRLCRWTNPQWDYCNEPYKVVYLWGCWECHAWREYFYCRKHYAEARYHGRLEGPWCDTCSQWSGEYEMKTFNAQI